jgi:hypothetical protein
VLEILSSVNVAVRPAVVRARKVLMKQEGCDGVWRLVTDLEGGSRRCWIMNYGIVTSLIDCTHCINKVIVFSGTNYAQHFSQGVRPSLGGHMKCISHSVYLFLVLILLLLLLLLLSTLQSTMNLVFF